MSPLVALHCLPSLFNVKQSSMGWQSLPNTEWYIVEYSRGVTKYTEHCLKHTAPWVFWLKSILKSQWDSNNSKQKKKKQAHILASASIIGQSTKLTYVYPT